MKIGLVGPSYQERSKPFDAQRTINMYPVFDQQGKEVAALYGTPGLGLLAPVGQGPIRGVFAATNGRAFAVSGSVLYEVDAAGNSTQRGTISGTKGNISIEENGFQLAICDGESLYIFTYADNSFARVTDSDLPKVATVTFLDGYFVCNEVSSGRFWISALYDGKTWDALDFATAESSPDKLVRVISVIGQLCLLGDISTEWWTNTGDSAFPFERVSGVKPKIGIAAAHTAKEIDNSLFFIGRDDKGTGIVYRTSGFTPKRISTSAVEQALQRAVKLDECCAYSYQQDGHVFYIITGGDLETSWVFDLTAEQWHERAYLNVDGDFERHLGYCGMYAFGKTIIGDRRNGNLYEMSQDIFTDNGEPLAAERIYTHLADEDKPIRFKELRIGVESGVGLIDGVEPMISMCMSKDGGETWGNWYTTGMGKIGERKRKARFRRLGITEQMTFRVRITDPVKRAICGSYLR